MLQQGGSFPHILSADSEHSIVLRLPGMDACITRRHSEFCSFCLQARSPSLG